MKHLMTGLLGLFLMTPIGYADHHEGCPCDSACQTACDHKDAEGLKKCNCDCGCKTGHCKHEACTHHKDATKAAPAAPAKKK